MIDGVRSLRRLALGFGVVLVALAANIGSADDLADQLRSLDTGVVVVGEVRQPPLAGMLQRELSARLATANRADRLAWEQLADRRQWEAFRDARLAKLRESLGTFPKPDRRPIVRVTGKHVGDGFEVDNLVIETRPGLHMTANVYRPAAPARSLPGIMLVHSHQQPKHVAWRQDMGMTWARAGCVVIIPDLVGHGERQLHPFPESNPHDYHFRYDGGIQLHLLGDSLMGWFVWDLQRAVDVLLDQPGVDAQRILAISEPAGGGDVAAVAAALDPRITAAMINNFGGPQPETPYPLPPDAELTFEFAGQGSWESTRNLRRAASDGFLPWLIVASIAPRRVIYYHEFYWDRDYDPVWKRLRKIWQWYEADDDLVGLAGRGFVVGNEPRNTHWLAESRELLYPTLERWFAIPNPGREYSRRLPVADLLCVTPEERPRFGSAREVAARLAAEQVAGFQSSLSRLAKLPRREHLQRVWGNLLGPVAATTPRLGGGPPETEQLSNVRVERLHLLTDPGIVVPTLLLTPAGRAAPSDVKPPVVVCLTQQGKREFLQRQAAEIARLLREGSAVCLPDVRGTGETRASETRDRRSAATSLAAGQWMLGDSILAGRLRDLRTLLAYLRTRSDVDARRVSLWGESFVEPNPAAANLAASYVDSPRPAQSEPLGGILALLGGLFEDDVQEVTVHGCLATYQSLLDSPFTYVPLDAVIPGAIAAGDLPALAAGLAPRTMRIADAVNGGNQRVEDDALRKSWSATIEAYAKSQAADRLRLGASASREQ